MSETDTERFARFFPDPFHPNRDYVEREMGNDFIAYLQRYCQDHSIDAIVTTFGRTHSDVLSWLGETRQDTILRRAMQETGIDLSSWIGEEAGEEQ